MPAIDGLPAGTLVVTKKLTHLQTDGALKQSSKVIANRRLIAIRTEG